MADKTTERQYLSIYGNITSEQLYAIAYQAIPNLDELVDPKVQFENDLKGILQIIILAFVSHIKLIPEFQNYDI